MYFRPFFSNSIRAATFQHIYVYIIHIYIRTYIPSISHFECHRFDERTYPKYTTAFIAGSSGTYCSAPCTTFPSPRWFYFARRGGSMFRACTGSPRFARQRSPWLMDINNARHCCADKLLQSFGVSDEMRIKDGNWCKRVCLCTCIAYTRIYRERKREREREREGILSFKYIMLCSVRVAACSF